ncbi:hypothetical protein JX265_006184 [Neoarthrinium moseri]|uniref:Uncharacterized protein n=1 Tax=Neoarthrinium moseri TaxID=1658444 RepID=A0A9P9WMZ1_9PEZI|nr:hypothetical protein JX265_006184 [Neoarthrinium moseri]
MQSRIYFLVTLASRICAFKTYPACPPLAGDVTVNVSNIFPESAEFAPSNCRFYIGNGSLIEHDPYTSTTREINLPGVSHNTDYFVCGVDFGYASGTIYVAASSRYNWWPTIGGNLTGPSRLMKYSPLNNEIIWSTNVGAVVSAEERETNTPFAGFQDMAEDEDGNVYFLGSFGNIILKVDPEGKATKFYSPDPVTDKSYGFGGAFMTRENVLVVGDAISQGFVIFDLSSSNPSLATFTKPTGHPKEFDEHVMECDAVTAPRRYEDNVALCSLVVDRKFSNHGMITVYTSVDGWKSSNFAGMIRTEFGQSPDIWSTAQLGTADRVYALSSSLPYDDAGFPNTKSTTLVDITDKVDQLVGKFGPNQDRNAHEEL